LFQLAENAMQAREIKNLDDWYRNSGVFDSERLEKLYEYRRKTNVNGLRKTNVSSLEEEVEEDRELELDTEGKKKRII